MKVSLFNYSGEFPVSITYSLFGPGPHNLTIVANSTYGKVAKFITTFTNPDPFSNNNNNYFLMNVNNLLCFSV